MKKILLILTLIFGISSSMKAQLDFHFGGVMVGDPIGTSSDPASLELSGEMTYYWNKTLGKLRKWNGTVWSDMILPAGVGNVYEDELTDAENNINVGFTLVSTTLVYFNGELLPNILWSGEGTTVLNVSLSTKLYDKLTVKN